MSFEAGSSERIEQALLLQMDYRPINLYHSRSRAATAPPGVLLTHFHIVEQRLSDTTTTTKNSTSLAVGFYLRKGGTRLLLPNPAFVKKKKKC